MTILHIANSYGGTSVYTNLYTAIDQNSDCTQWVHVPLNSRNHSRVGNKMIDFRCKDSKIEYSTILKNYHRFLYGLKISAIVKDIERKFDMSKVDVIHAGTLCLDGAAAYELSRKYNIPYIVAVRNTDVNSYYKKLKWRHGYFTNIMKHADKVIFISPKFKEIFLDTFVPSNARKQIEEHLLVVPNGIGKVFLENKSTVKKTLGDTFRLIFVAAFYKGKGLEETIKAIDILRSKGYNVTLNAIGKGLPDRPQDAEYIKTIAVLEKDREWITTQPFKKPLEIIEEMKSADAFIMVSKPETFGLVYVEALSQHLPIIYAQGQGFDGYYPDGFVGYPAEGGNVESIAEKIENIINNYETISGNVCSLNLDIDFEWNNISRKYIDLYKKAIK